MALSRKTSLTVGVVLIAIDLGLTAALLDAGAQRLAAMQDGAAAVAELVDTFLRPLPRLAPPF